MKHLLLILASIFLLTSCGNDNSWWSPEDDIKAFLAANPYGVVFENGTKGDLIIKPKGLASESLIIVHPGEVSDTRHGSKPSITIKYNGEGTLWSEYTKHIELTKDKVTHITITYPWTD